MKKPLVSIITNTLNRSDLIHRCIESIQKQTYQNYEHIIADGSDNEETKKVVLSYNDPKIKYVHVPSGGPVIQTRTAFEMSGGDYITFLDDDDEYLPEKLEKQLNLIQSLPEDYGFIYGSMTYYDYDTNEQLRIHEASYSGEGLLPLAISKPIICGTPTLMFRRNVFESIGGTWISGIGNEMSDWALVCKALSQGWKVGALKESYLRIYVNHGGMRMSDSQFYKNHAERYIKFHMHFLSTYDNIFKQNPKLAYYHYYNLCRYYTALKDRKNAWKYWKLYMNTMPNLKHTIKSFIGVLILK